MIRYIILIVGNGLDHSDPRFRGIFHIIIDMCCITKNHVYTIV
ncbi:MAG: hypothetical protein RR048_07265 [Oscillospiraceae bacterium]